MGFVLIDMLPFAFNYSAIGRQRSLYSKFVQMHLCSLIDKFNKIAPFIEEDYKMRVMLQRQMGPLRDHFPSSHFAQEQINEFPAINDNRFGVPFVENIVQGFELL